MLIAAFLIFSEDGMTSERKAASNRKNSLMSTGPKTARGKRNSKFNATKHGFYSRELNVSELDRNEFDRMCIETIQQLQPQTYYQRLACDRIIFCCWRLKQAARLETKQIKIMLGEECQKDAQSASSIGCSSYDGWFGSSRTNLNRAIRVVEQGLSDLNHSGYLRDENKQTLAQLFGNDFVQLLTEWQTMDTTVMQMAFHMVEHRKRYGGDAPNREEKAQTFVRDPQQSAQMISKLLQEKIISLQEMHKAMERRSTDFGCQENSISHFNPQFVVAMTRQVEQALEWFQRLKIQGL
jgi:hypothetical protein